MRICTRSLARVPSHARRLAVPVLLEHFRRNRQDFRKGWNYVFTRGRRRPEGRELPIVPVDRPVYLSTYSHRIENPATCVLDRI